MTDSKVSGRFSPNIRLATFEFEQPSAASLRESQSLLVSFRCVTIAFQVGTTFFRRSDSETQSVSSEFGVLSTSPSYFEIRSCSKELDDIKIVSRCRYSPLTSE
jgi:hypothetical protein